MRALLGALLFSSFLLFADGAVPALAAPKGCSTVKMTIESDDFSLTKTFDEERIVEQLAELIARYGRNGAFRYTVRERTITLYCQG